MKKHSFNRVSDVRNQINTRDRVSNVTSYKSSRDESKEQFPLQANDNPQCFENSVKKNKKPLKKMKSVGNVENNLSEVLAVKAEQIRQRFLSDIKLDDEVRDDINDDVLLKELQTKSEGLLDQDPSKTVSCDENQSKIPLSKARMKRRHLKQAAEENLKTKEETTLHLRYKMKWSKSTVNIVNYRPGYTWNRGGRVKELRIRCLARKFLFVWRQKTFGRVPLSNAIEHYEFSLKRQTFGVWYEFWWEIVKEWRLAVRAECHFRYKLGCTAFKAWREFIIMRRISNAKRQRAVDHYQQKQMEKVWSCWKKYLKERSALKVLYSQAEDFQTIQITRHAWLAWRNQLSLIEDRKENEVLALQFWSYRLQAQHWLVWKAAMSERARIQEQMTNVCMYYNSVVATKCVNAWKLYAANRRTKKSHKAFADRMYQTKLREKCFHHWSQRWHLICSLRQHHHRIEEIAQSFRLRWALWRWNKYVHDCKAMKFKEKLAIDHYHHHLKHFGLASFRLNVVHSHIKDMRQHLSLQLEASQLQKRFWLLWVKKFDQRQEDKMASQTALAVQFYTTNLKQRCLSALEEYCLWRRYRKTQYAKADAHFYLHTAPKCLFHMKLFVQLERACQSNALSAICFFKANVQRKVFTKWKLGAQNIRDERMMHRMAVLHHESILTKSFFLMWKERALLEEEERQRMEGASHHYIYSLCKNVINGWKAVVQAKRKKEVNLIKAIQFHKRHVEQKCLLSWRKWMTGKKDMKVKKETAVKYHSHHVLACCIQEWKSFWMQGQQFQSKANIFLSQYREKKLQLVLMEWRSISKGLAIKRKKKFAATVHFNRCLMKKIIREWQSWAAVQAYKKQQARQLLDQAVIQLQQLKLFLYFKQWQAELDKKKQMKIKEDQADEHLCFQLRSKCLDNWKGYHSDCLRKRLLKGQSCKFNEIRLTGKHFFIWRARWMDKKEENSKTEIALWQWSLTLERKVLIAWEAFKDNQKQKKLRLLEAAQFRRQRLLQDACCQWLTTADSLSQVRASTAARYQTKAVMDSFRLVQKCALRWKSWARRQAAFRGRGQLASKPLTFPVSSKARLPPNLIEFHTIPSLSDEKEVRSWADVNKPQRASASPMRMNSVDGLKSRQRALPTRPSFLMESLQRAGLTEDMFSDKASRAVEDMNDDSDSTLTGHDNILVLPPSPDRPSTGRFSPHVQSPSQFQRGRDLEHQTQEQPNSSFSAEVLSGSNSTLGPFGQEVKPLHLDAEHSSSQTTSSLSPQLFTPSTQRSQFSGNPLLYSSPVSDTGRSRPVTTRAEESQRLFDSDSDGKMVRGNIGTDSQGLQRLQFWEDQQQERDKNILKDAFQNDLMKDPAETKEPVVLLKPEYFMQKPPTKVEKLEKRRSSEDLAKSKTRNTPRSFATWDTSVGVGGVFPDMSREVKGMLRHTPRELTSPRRAAPQGILHNRASDSDADVSPLNTARSRGTVTFASPKLPTPEEEIISIRDRLRQFSQQKQKLRSLQKKYLLLSDWIEEQNRLDKSNTTEEEGQSEDSRSATEELDLVRLEVAQLKTIVEGQQPICEKLVQRAQVLAEQLNLPF